MCYFESVSIDEWMNEALSEIGHRLLFLIDGAVAIQAKGIVEEQNAAVQVSIFIFTFNS